MEYLENKGVRRGRENWINWVGEKEGKKREGKGEKEEEKDFEILRSFSM